MLSDIYIDVPQTLPESRILIRIAKEIQPVAEKAGKKAKSKKEKAEGVSTPSSEGGETPYTSATSREAEASASL